MMLVVDQSSETSKTEVEDIPNFLQASDAVFERGSKNISLSTTNMLQEYLAVHMDEETPNN